MKRNEKDAAYPAPFSNLINVECILKKEGFPIKNSHSFSIHDRKYVMVDENTYSKDDSMYSGPT